jgi:hypothetical protein
MMLLAWISILCPGAYLIIKSWYFRAATPAQAPLTAAARTAVAGERSRLRRVQLNRLMSLVIFSIVVPSLATTCPGEAASNGATIQRVPIATTANTPDVTIYDATNGTIQ